MNTLVVKNDLIFVGFFIIIICVPKNSWEAVFLISGFILMKLSE